MCRQGPPHSKQAIHNGLCHHFFLTSSRPQRWLSKGKIWGRAQLDQTMRVKQRKENKNVCLQIKAPRGGSNLKERSVPLSFRLSLRCSLAFARVHMEPSGRYQLSSSTSPHLIFKFFLMLCVCVSVCHVSPGPLGGQKRVLDTWNWLSRLLVVICLWLLGTELRPSRRGGSMPNCWAISPVPLPYLLRQDLFLSLIPELMDFTRCSRELQRST